MNLQIQTHIPAARLLNWQTWLKEADQYLKAAVLTGEKSKFGTDIRYNLLSMALESYVMSMLDFHNELPLNHTYTDLMEALEQVLPLDSKLKEKILEYENIQSICSVEKYHRENPTEEDLLDLKWAIEQICSMAHDVCAA